MKKYYEEPVVETALIIDVVTDNELDPVDPSNFSGGEM